MGFVFIYVWFCSGNQLKTFFYTWNSLGTLESRTQSQLKIWHKLLEDD